MLPRPSPSFHSPSHLLTTSVTLLFTSYPNGTPEGKFNSMLTAFEIASPTTASRASFNEIIGRSSCHFRSWQSGMATNSNCSWRSTHQYITSITSPSPPPTWREERTSCEETKKRQSNDITWRNTFSITVSFCTTKHKLIDASTMDASWAITKARLRPHQQRKTHLWHSFDGHRSQVSVQNHSPWFC